MDRREFLKMLSALSGAFMISGTDVLANTKMTSDKIGEVLPKRPLGNTGEHVTMLGLGGYHVGRNHSEKEAQAIIETSITGGVRFFDNSESYQNGGAERRYGKYLVPKYRDEIFLMTKTDAENDKQARKSLEGSLKRLNTDYLDLWQIHSIYTPKDVDHLLNNGVLDVMLQAKKEGKVKHIGFTGHNNYKAHKHMLERTHEFETCQMPINVLDPSYLSFIKNVLPILVKRDMGILAMKTLADGRFFSKTRSNASWHSNDPVVPGRITVKDALYFAWSLPISVLISGPDNHQMMQEKIDLARNFKPLNEQQRQILIKKVADLSDGHVEYYKNKI
ncbi:MAG TPA: aldo/keto reductase [Balneolales bacterium]|nr:aldo/keto reductase [Balneolales bacterium]